MSNAAWTGAFVEQITCLFIERLNHENRSHGISDLQKTAEEGFSNLVLKGVERLPGRATVVFRAAAISSEWPVFCGCSHFY